VAGQAQQTAYAFGQYLAERPSMKYEPSSPNKTDPYGFQLAFHRAGHTIRFLCPGNRGGKTSGMGHEVNAWATHSNRWQRTPAGPVSMIWYGPGLSQWGSVRHELLERFCFDKPHQYKLGDHCYVWPDGSRLQWRSYEAGWTVEQGTAPHLVLFDELPPWDLFREIQMRGGGDVQTRIVVAATQTMGTSWMEEVLYRPWLKWHQERGLDEEGAMREQSHKYIWCWPRGGIRSNPAMGQKDFERYETDIVYSSEAEKNVRLHGGFGDWSGASVFDLAGVRWLQEQAKRAMAAKQYITLNGSIIPHEKEAA
jgi:hypothetical protein